jgi:transcriptional regulator with XRE-family HTH domain
MQLNLTHSKIINELDFLERNFYYELGLSIRNYRRAKNFSQEYMAAKLKISQNAYSKIETGKCSCSVFRLMNILSLLDLEPQNVLLMEGKHIFNLEMVKI